MKITFGNPIVFFNPEYDMKKQFAILLLGFFWIPSVLLSFNVELNTSYDHFRSLPDGTWNGNNGAVLAANADVCLYDYMGVQAGASYGVYNWDGRENYVFKNPRRTLQQVFVTAGLFSSFCQFNAGIVYDRLFTKNFSVYSLNPSIDQVRFQGGYEFCNEELGIWGTVNVTTAHKQALGIPVSFRAISQINVFWTHAFDNYAKTTVWIGMPYKNSLMFSHRLPGTFIAGFALRAPLTDRLYLDGHGSYMNARSGHGTKQSGNYAANICIGITYSFGDECPNEGCAYMPVANNSNFIVDTSLN